MASSSHSINICRMNKSMNELCLNFYFPFPRILSRLLYNPVLDYSLSTFFCVYYDQTGFLSTNKDKTYSSLGTFFSVLSSAPNPTVCPVNYSSYIIVSKCKACYISMKSCPTALIDCPFFRLCKITHACYAI